MEAAPARDPHGPLFFVHVMKTGGSTFAVRLKRELGRESVFPYFGIDPVEVMTNLSVGYLTSQPLERLNQVRAFAGHYPFFAARLVPTPSLVLTILRDPVERAISHLKQHRREKGQESRSLEDIYERGFARRLYIDNFQVRVFALTEADGADDVQQPIEIDDRRMSIAKEHLEEVDILGLTDHHAEFVAEVVTRLGWSNRGVGNQRVSEPVEVPSSLRQKLIQDNEADREFYAFARDLYERRRRRGSVVV